MRSIWVFGVGFALTSPTAVNALGITPIDNGQCVPGSLTITSDGCSGCDDFNLCQVSASSGNCTGPGCTPDEDCTFECMSVDGNSSTVVVLMEFANSQEVASGRASGGVPRTSNEDTVVGSIELSAATTTFVMAGGSDGEYPRGKVASVTLASDFISSASSVTRVVLKNLDLQDEADALSELIPSSVEELDLTNSMISSFPVNLSNLTSLRHLTVDDSFITTVDSSSAIDSLVTLSLQSNRLTSFTGVFSNLENLYLDANNLTSFPSTIFSHSNLKALNVSGNSFASRTFTRNQVEFLSNLETLDLSASDFCGSLECDDAEQITVHDVVLCVSDESVSSSSSAVSNGTKTTNSSISTSAIVGIVGGILVVLFICGLLYIYLRWKRSNPPSHVNYRGPYNGDHFCAMDHDHHREQQSVVRTSEQITLSPNDTIVFATSLSQDERTCSSRNPVITDSNSSYPSSRTTENAQLKRRQSRFLTIWNDPELLSLQLRADDLKDVKQLGKGEYSTVWLVQYQNAQLLASRRQHPDRRAKSHTRKFVEEIKLTANIHHPNLVNLVGAAWTTENDLQALFEYMDGGNLQEYLSQPSTPVGWTLPKFDIALAVIEAMVYLHSFVPPLVHSGINSKNVLLSPNVRAKLSDFGISRFTETNYAFDRWVAPEVLRGGRNGGPAADIYSFGVLLMGLGTNGIPLTGKRWKAGNLGGVLQVGKQSKVSSTPALRMLIGRCMSKDSTKRPTATTIAYKLRAIQEEMAVML